MNIKGLIFDMDGLIFDSERIVQRAWNRIGNELGYGNVGEHIYNTIGFNLNSRNLYFQESIGETFPTEDFNLKTRAAFREIVDKEGLEIKSGAKELIVFAKTHGFKLAVASSSRRDYAIKLLSDAGLYKYFDHAVFGDMVKHAKPDPEIYLTAADQLGLKPEECLALEDAPSGVRSASSAGMPVVLVPDLVQPTSEIKKLVTYQMENLHQVINLLHTN